MKRISSSGPWSLGAGALGMTMSVLGAGALGMTMSVLGAGALGMTMLALVGCGGPTSTGDDDDDSSSSSTGDGPTTLELAPGQGIDLDHLTLLEGVKSYSVAANQDQLVYPSDTPCKPPPGHGAPGEYPATCGYLWHTNDSQKYDSFDAAFAALKGVTAEDLDLGDFFWSVEGDDDTHWGLVLGDNVGKTYVFWLEGVTSDGRIRYQYQLSTTR
jgi:hypothetical protein